MNIFTRVKEFVMKLFRKNAEQIFKVNAVTSEEMQKAQELWHSIIKGTPDWTGSSVRSINFGKYICQYTAKKACLEIAVRVEGSQRADFISRIIQQMIEKSIRDKTEDACGAGGIILKPNGSSNSSGAIDYVMPWNFLVTEQSTNGDILGIIFLDRIRKGNDHYTRLEYHHFVEGEAEDGTEGRFYRIENRAFRSSSESSLGMEIPLTYVGEWSGIQPECTITNVERPLFGYLKMPFNNTIDYSSPEGVSVFSNCTEELRDLDIAWSRKSDETEDSTHITFIDENSLMKRDKKGERRRTDLPRFVKGIRRGVDAQSSIDEHVPTLLTQDRIADINSILSMISTKAGFSQGQFILDRKSGKITATQVESDDSETVETITDVRCAIKRAVKDLIYALDKYCDIVYSLPDGYVNALDDSVPDEDIFYFKDLLASFEQDRTRACNLMVQGMYSKRKYLKEYEGFSDSEIDEMFEEIKKENKAGKKSGFYSEE